MVMTRWIMLAFLGAAACGCGSNKSPARDDAGRAAVAVPPVAPAPALTRVDEAAARALLDRWLAAQNQGDFAAYQACYATRVDGIKRVGTRSARFNRAGWLADRKRMFKRKMVVAVSELELATTSTTARARFIQKWTSGKYEDVGAKEILLVREGGELRIAHEEMLESTITHAPQRAELPADKFLFTVEGGKDRYVILGDGNGLAHGEPELLSSYGVYVTRAAISAGDLPASMARWQGREVAGGDCRATVVGLVLLDRVVPHYSTVYEWKEGAGESGVPATNAQIAADVFGVGHVRIAGKLDGACPAGQFVRAADQPAWVIAEPVDDPALAARAATAFRELPAYKEIQRRFASEVADAKVERWEEFDDGARDEIAVKLYRQARTGKISVMVWLHTGVGCGGFDGTLWALFEGDGKGELSVVNSDLALESGGVVVAAIDLEDDGELEWLIDFRDPSQTSLLVRSDGERLRERSVYFRDCSC